MNLGTAMLREAPGRKDSITTGKSTAGGTGGCRGFGGDDNGGTVNGLMSLTTVRLGVFYHNLERNPNDSVCILLRADT